MKPSLPCCGPHRRHRQFPLLVVLTLWFAAGGAANVAADLRQDILRPSVAVGRFGSMLDAWCIDAHGKVAAICIWNDIGIYDVSSGTRIGTVRYPVGSALGNSDPVKYMAMDYEKRTLFTASDRARVRAWDILTGAREGEVEGCEPGPVSLSPDGRFLAVGGTIFSTSPLHKLFSTGGNLVHFGPDNFHCFASGFELENKVQFWTIEGETFTPSSSFLRSGTGPFALDFVDSLIAENGRGGQGVVVWNFRTGEGVRSIKNPASHIEFSPDGRYLGLAQLHGCLYDVSTGDVVAGTEYNGWSVPQVALSENGAIFAAPGEVGEENARAITLEAFMFKQQPPYLEASVAFDDSRTGADGALNSGETADIVVNVRNTGPGGAFGITLNASANNPAVSVPGVNYLGAVPAGRARAVRIPMSASWEAAESQLTVTVSLDEMNGFGCQPVSLTVPVRRGGLPALELGEGLAVRDTCALAAEDPSVLSKLSEKDFAVEAVHCGTNGVVENDEIVEVSVPVLNSGDGEAYGVVLTARALTTGIEMLRGEDSIGVIRSGETRTGRFLFQTPRYLSVSQITFSISAADSRASVPRAEITRQLFLQQRMPDMVVTYTIHDGDSPDSRGNSDGKIQKGEIIELPIVLENRGTTYAKHAMIVASTTAPGIVFTKKLGGVKYVPSGSSSLPISLVFAVQQTAASGQLPLQIEIRQEDFPWVKRTVTLVFQ